MGISKTFKSYCDKLHHYTHNNANDVAGGYDRAKCDGDKDGFVRIHVGSGGALVQFPTVIPLTLALLGK